MYEFGNMRVAMYDLKTLNRHKEKSQVSKTLNDIQKELNKFFKDSDCTGIIITENENLFFGMCVLPVLNSKDTRKILDGNPDRINKYIIEIDSQLLDPLMDITEDELIAILLHEVGHLVNDATNITKVSDQIAYYISKEGVVLNYEEALRTDSLLKIGIFRSIHKLTSIFERNDEEFLADEFVRRAGYGHDLESAFKKIINKKGRIRNVGKTEENTFITLIWTLSLYKEMGKRHRTIQLNLDEARFGEPSSLFKKLYTNVIQSLRMNKGRNQYSSVIIQETAGVIKENGFMKLIRDKRIKEIEDEVYEYSIRINMINSNVEALDILKSLNLRINLLQEYIDRTDLQEYHITRYTDIKSKYEDLRKQLTTSGSFDPKQYGLYVEYPKISY